MRKILLPLVVNLAWRVSVAQLQVDNLLCENLSNPMGVGVAQPRFSWQLSSTKRNVLQAAYEVRVAHDMSSLTKGSSLVWSSGKITSDSSVQVVYKGSPLQSGTKYFWQVRVWDNLGESSKWSEPTTFQMALLHLEDWKANW